MSAPATTHAEAERAILGQVYSYLRRLGRERLASRHTDPTPDVPKNDPAPTGQVGAGSGAC